MNTPARGAAAAIEFVHQIHNFPRQGLGGDSVEHGLQLLAQGFGGRRLFRLTRWSGEGFAPTA